MSKLTSSTSASDTLIQPTGATSGQTLTWNDSTGQFEPTNPPASGLKVWAASTAYVAGELVVFVFGGVNTILRRISAGTSGLTIDAVELAAWEYVSQASTLGFIASTLIPKGFRIAVTAGNHYESISNRTTGTIFNAGEQTNWMGLSEPECRPWVPNTFYVGGDMVLQPIFGIATYIRRISVGTSEATFDSVEAGTWGYVSQAGIPITFLPNTFVFDRFIASFNGVLYYSNGTRITGASFDAAEQANWVALTTAPSVLPNFTSSLGLRGDGTNVPVTDARLNFATANAVDIGGTSGLRVSTATAGQIDLNLLGTAAAGGNALKLTAQSAVGSNNNGGSLEFTSGATTGSGFSSIKFNTPLSFGTAGATTVNAPALTWQMFTNAQNTVLEGVGNNNTLTARLDKNLKIATTGLGNLQVQAEATGNLALGVAGTGPITIGSAGKTTTISGLVKQPGKSVFKAQRATSTQAVAANLQTTVIFNASSVLGTSPAAVTLNAATGIMTFTRTGTFRISGCISVQSATANARVGLAFVPGTAVCSSTNIENNLLATANVPRGLRFEYIFTCNTVGTFSIQIGSTAALTVGFNQGTIFAPTKTNCIIEEIA